MDHIDKEGGIRPKISRGNYISYVLSRLCPADIRNDGDRYIRRVLSSDCSSMASQECDGCQDSKRTNDKVGGGFKLFHLDPFSCRSTLRNVYMPLTILNFIIFSKI